MKQTLQIRLEEADIKSMDEDCKTFGVSRSEFIRLAMARFIDSGEVHKVLNNYKNAKAGRVLV